MSDQEKPPPGGEDDQLAKSRQVVADAESEDKGPDEATRITRIVLVAVILVLVGGLVLLLVLGPADDNSARRAVDDLSRSQVSIRDELEAETTTTTAVTTETAAPAETAPPDSQAPAPGPSPSPSPAAPPGPSPSPSDPASVEVFYAVDSQGRLPMKVGLTSQISIRNNGDSEGSWALNASAPLRVDGRSGTNGRLSGGSITVVNVTIDSASAPGQPTESSVRFDTPNGESKTIRVYITP